MFKKTSLYWKLSFLAAVILIIYLNRAYAYFFNYLDTHQIFPTNYSSNLNFKSAKPVSSDVDLIFLGDSLTFGVGVNDARQTYPYFIDQQYSQKNNIVFHNLAFPGAKTSQVIQQQLPKIKEIKPNIIILEVGVNDIFALTTNPQFKQDFNLLLSKTLALQPDKLIVVNIPYLTNPKVMLFPYQLLFDWRTRQFNSIIYNLVQQKSDPKITFVDLYDQTSRPFQSDQTYFSEDGFHPSAKGYKLWSNLIYANFNN